ncbi:MAG: hypothetical protein IJ048_04305 [Clostridia bacterium]|nr:hypothetical protein [Clostridia bacterium]
MSEKKDAPSSREVPAEDQERADRQRDLEDGLELMADARRMLRGGGVALGVFIALLGWYLSREWGVWFLIGGVALGVLIGGGFAFVGLLGGALAKKYMSGRDGKE